MSTVLIVDDDAALRKALATALSDLGHEPAEAADGAAALAWLVRRRADAVLLDLRMPGMERRCASARLTTSPSPSAARI
jgi:CheY-like chemotaxis protein